MLWFARYDLFEWFRLVLGWVVTIYATVITVQSLWGWYVWFAGQDKYIGMLRRYVIVHGLRLRFGTFWGDLIICVLLTIAFFMIWRAHWIIYQVGHTLEAERAQSAKQVQPRQAHSQHVQ